MAKRRSCCVCRLRESEKHRKCFTLSVQSKKMRTRRLVGGRSLRVTSTLNTARTQRLIEKLPSETCGKRTNGSMQISGKALIRRKHVNHIQTTSLFRLQKAEFVKDVCANLGALVLEQRADIAQYFLGGCRGRLCRCNRRAPAPPSTSPGAPL